MCFPLIWSTAAAAGGNKQMHFFLRKDCRIPWKGAWCTCADQSQETKCQSKYQNKKLTNSKMLKLKSLQIDKLARGEDDKMTRWQDDKMARGKADKMTKDRLKSSQKKNKAAFISHSSRFIFWIKENTSSMQILKDYHLSGLCVSVPLFDPQGPIRQ